MDQDIIDLLAPFGLDSEEGIIRYGEAILASMRMEPGGTFTKEEFISASQAFYAGLEYLYPYISN